MENISRKISLLIAKANGTDNAAEAGAFMAKAQELMARYQVDRAMLEIAGKSPTEEITVASFELPSSARMQKGSMMIKIARALSCRGFFVDTQDNEGNWVTNSAIKIVGFPSDIVNTVMLWHSLCTQMETAYATARKNGEHIREDGTKVHQRTFKASFCDAFQLAAAARVRKHYTDTLEKEAEKETGVALVLRSRAQDVCDYVATHFDVQLMTMNHNLSPEGRHAGNEAGMRADIGQAKFQNTTKALNA